MAKDLFTKLPAPKLQPKWSREKQGQSTHHTNKNSFNKLEKILTSYSKEAEDSAPKPSYSSAYREEDNKLKDHNLDPALIPDSTDWIRGHHDSSVVHVDAHALRNENWRDPYMEQKEKHDKHKVNIYIYIYIIEIKCQIPTFRHAEAETPHYLFGFTNAEEEGRRIKYVDNQ